MAVAPRKPKVLLLNPPGDKLYSRDKYCTSISKSDYYWPPIDLLMLSGTLSSSCEVAVIDAIVEGLGFGPCRAWIQAWEPDVIVFVTCSASWRRDFQFLRELKGDAGLRMVASGGFLLSQGIRAMERHPFLDAILLDFTTGDILDYVRNNHAQPRNMLYRRHGEIIEAARTRDKEFNVPIPRHDLFPIKKYRFPLGTQRLYTCVITSLGCPFHCYFCVPATLPYKVRNIQNVLEELRFIKSLGIPEVLFQDSTFSISKPRTIELCQGMIDEKLNLKWICLSRVDTVDEELLTTMKKAGCHSIQFGVESGNEEMLKRMGKGFTKEKVRETFRLCHKLEIRTNGFFILGLPGEDEASIRETISFAKELNCDVASFSLAMPHPGTRLGQQAVEAGLIGSDMEEYDDASLPIMETPQLPREKLLQLRSQAYREFYFRFSYILNRLLRTRSYFQFKMQLKQAVALFHNFYRKEYD